ncbi:putative F-box domain-containing protein [Rosa chinensis]|uniref:Putative F-box domain-containing protein n=1 Tax=Rosa chinensis TaxID=74649 RepID=A0A2P6Q337_ROSCH|nr:F-box protein At2g40910 [Rosa chinensis]PRQ28574.1 putative F-box domain-containing protein [Rosa chinensis]
MTEEVYELPFDVILEILTWLPVNSLLRFKCVCKQWCSLIKEDRKFITKYMDRATPLQLTHLHKCGDFYKVDYGYGLYLEKSDDFGCRIRNPATQQVLYLPYADEDIVLLRFYYDSVTDERKVLRRRNSDNVLSYTFEIITIGKDDQWRPLYNIGKSPRSVHFYGADEGSDWLYNDFNTVPPEIHSCDTRRECITTNAVPPGAFTDLTKVSVLLWNDRLAVGDIANEALNVLVLEDFKEHKWSKNKIVGPLKFLKDDPLFQKNWSIPWSFDSEKLMFLMRVNGSLRRIFYDTRREIIMKIKDERMEPGMEHMEFYRPSLVTVKGMIPENAGSIASNIS